MTQQSNAVQALEPLAIRRDEGEARWWFAPLPRSRPPPSTPRARPAPHPPSGAEGEPTPEEIERLKAIVKEHGYELLI